MCCVGLLFSRASYLAGLLRPQIIQDLELEKYGMHVCRCVVWDCCSPVRRTWRGCSGRRSYKISSSRNMVCMCVDALCRIVVLPCIVPGEAAQAADHTRSRAREIWYACV